MSRASEPSKRAFRRPVAASTQGRRRTAIAIMIACVAVIAATVVLRRAPDAFSEDPIVSRLLEENRWNEARALIRRGLGEHPNSPEPPFALARLEFGQGRLTEAYQALQKARSLGHPPEPLDRLQGLIFLEGGRLDEAERILSPILERSGGKDLAVAEALARAFLQTYRLPAAKRVLDRWIEVAPNDAKPYLWLAEIDRRTVADPNIPVGRYQEALRRDPTLIAAKLGLAEAFLAAKRPAEAARGFEEYLAIKPDDPKALVGAAKAARDLGDDEAAAVRLDAALKLAPRDPAALKERAYVEQRRGTSESALLAIDRALEIDPNDTEILYQRSLALARLGRNREAEDVRGRVSRLREDQKKVLEIHEKLLADPDNLALRGEVARWMIDHGQAEEAAKWARLILAKKPADPEMNRLLARFHRERGEAGLANFYEIRAGGEN